jgi:nicotinate phosphoribosyltransferase
LNYASCSAEGYLALVDSYNTIESGVKNFLITALVFGEVDVKPVGIRLDSGDLSSLSKYFLHSHHRTARKMFIELGKKYKKPYFKDFIIMASNEIHEDLLYDLQKRGHEIDNFGVGTNLITCVKQPALGMVYKLVSINDTPRLKLSEDIDKITLPGLKSVYRIYLADPKKPSFDVIALRDEQQLEEKKAFEVITKDRIKKSFTPVRVELLNPLAFDGKVLIKPLEVKEGRELIFNQLDNFDPSIIKKEDPKEYEVHYTVKLYKLFEDLIKCAKSE